MSSPPEVCWSLRGDSFVWEELPHAHALFHPHTGETHIVSDLPFLILSKLDRRPRAVAEIADAVAGPLALDSSAIEKINSALTFLERAEIVESTGCIRT